MKQRWYCCTGSTIIRQRLLLTSSQHQQQQLKQMFLKQNNNHHPYQSFSIKSMKSYGPVLKEGPPSYRKVIRDRHYRFNKRIVYEQNHLQYDVNELQNKLSTNENSENDEPIWLIRFENAQLQYPMISSSVSSSVSLSSSSFVTKKHQQAKEAALRRRQRLLERKQQQLQLRSKRRANNDSNLRGSSNHNNVNPNPIFYINQLEIRANMKQNQIRSRNARYGTGHVLLGRNGCGKSLLLHSILHSYTTIRTSIAQQQQQQQKDQEFLKERNIQSSEETTNSSLQQDSNRMETTSEIHSPTLLSVADDTIQQQRQSEDSHHETTTNEEDNEQHEQQHRQQRLEIDVNTSNPYLVDPSKLQLQGIPNQSNTAISVPQTTPTTTTFPTIAYVSFESHQELLDMGGTVWSILTKSNSSGGQLTKGMQYLIVRFGLYPLLTRDVTTLSTGEIRKVMIINAVAQQPHLLILDNAFDGLDAPSRQVLKDIIIKTLNGFQKSDTLVQGINSKDVTNNRRNTQHYTQVLLVTHRHEEICDEISRVTFLHPPKMGLPISTERRSNRNSKELLYESAGQELMEFDISTIGEFARKDNMTGLHIEPWFDETLPTEEEILQFWNGRDTPSSSSSSSSEDEKVTPKETIPKGQLIVHSKHFHISRDDKDLISDLNWKMNYGERWWLSGLNGAGKSTLSKYLITTLLQQQVASSPSGKDRAENDDESFLRIHLRSNDVNYVSTERHLSLSKSNDTGLNIIRNLVISDKHIDNPQPSKEIIHQVMRWLRLPKQLLLRPFNQISQGEQKMLLIAGIISFRPSLIILDEALQGLDVKNRHRVMGVVDRICSTTEISIIYVTHHYEDLIPSLTHAIHLNEGKAVFKGSVETFDGHNTLWSEKIKFVPENERERNEDGTFKIKDIKKRRTRRVW